MNLPSRWWQQLVVVRLRFISTIQTGQLYKDTYLDLSSMAVMACFWDKKKLSQNLIFFLPN
jgi:hypothetical protein